MTHEPTRPDVQSPRAGVTLTQVLALERRVDLYGSRITDLAPRGDLGLGLDPEGFASQVRYVSEVAKTMKSHGLEVGDVIFAVDGVAKDKIAHTAELYLKLRKTPGDQCKLEVIRNGKRMEVPLRTYRMSFRK